MKNYRLYDEIGRVDPAFIEEVFDYTEKAERERRHIMSKTFILKTAAIAACAAVVIGAGAAAMSRRELPVKQENHTAEVTDEAEQEDNTVVVERSYNEKIADGEEVRIETYIDHRIEHQGFAFTLKDITVSPTFPEGITKADISYTPTVFAYTDDDSEDNILGFIEKGYDYSEYAAENGLPPIETEEDYGWYVARKLSVSDVIGDDGRYNGPMDVSDESYRWIFLELEIENLTDDEQLEYMADMELCGGKYIVHPITTRIENGEVIMEEASYSFYTYSTVVCYMSEHTDKEMNGGQADIKKFHNLSFEPHEAKTLIIGYCVSDHFVFGELYLTLHNSEHTLSDDYAYLPLK